MATDKTRNEAVAAFDEWADHWGGHYAEGSPMLARINRFKKALDGEVSKGASVLDFGCGTGKITTALQCAGWHLTRCDASEEMLRQAQAEIQDTAVSGHHLAETSSASLPF